MPWLNAFSAAARICTRARSAVERAERQLEGVQVVERLVVVVLDVVDHFSRRRDVPGGLATPVRYLRERQFATVERGQAEIAQRSRQSDPHQVGRAHQVVAEVSAGAAALRS